MWRHPEIPVSDALAKSWIPLTCKMCEAYVQIAISDVDFVPASILPPRVLRGRMEV